MGNYLNFLYFLENLWRNGLKMIAPEKYVLQNTFARCKLENLVS